MMAAEERMFQPNLSHLYFWTTKRPKYGLPLPLKTGACEVLENRGPVTV